MTALSVEKKLKVVSLLKTKTMTNAEVAAETGISVRSVSRIKSEYKDDLESNVFVFDESDPNDEIYQIQIDFDDEVDHDEPDFDDYDDEEESESDSLDPDVTTDPKDEDEDDEEEYRFIVSKKALTIFAPDGTSYSVNSSSDKFSAAKQLIVDGEFEQAVELIDTKKLLQKYASGMVVIDPTLGIVKYGDKDITDSLGSKLIQVLTEGGNITPLVNFLKKLMNNASQNSVKMLWDFIVHNDIKLTDSGDIIAWKKVTSTHEGLRDSHFKKVPNDLGTTVKMARSQVVDDPNQTCTYGLHVGAWGYVGSFSGDTVLRVIINPEDVVSVPYDYNGMKMRVSKYFVDAIVDRELNVLEDSNGIVSKTIICDKDGNWELV